MLVCVSTLLDHHQRCSNSTGHLRGGLHVSDRVSPRSQLASAGCSRRQVSHPRVPWTASHPSVDRAAGFV